METKEDPLPEVDEKVTIIERELLKLHQEVDVSEWRSDQ